MLRSAGETAARRYSESGMESALPILILLAMFAVLGVLVLGIVNLARGNNPQRSQKLMQSRVLLQGLVLLLFAIFMLFFRH